MQVSKGIKTPIEEGVEKWSLTAEVSRRYRGITHQNQEQKLDRSTRCWEAIEKAGAFSIYPPGIEKLSRMETHSRSIHQVLRSYRGCNKKKLKKLDRQQGIEEVSSQLFKNSFLRWEKHRHECNPTCNSTNDPINILSSQNHLSIKILSTWIFKNTHTHLTSLTNFIFQKQVKTV